MLSAVMRLDSCLLEEIYYLSSLFVQPDSSQEFLDGKKEKKYLAHLL